MKHKVMFPILREAIGRGVPAASHCIAQACFPFRRQIGHGRLNLRDLHDGVRMLGIRTIRVRESGEGREVLLGGPAVVR